MLQQDTMTHDKKPKNTLTFLLPSFVSCFFFFLTLLSFFSLFFFLSLSLSQNHLTKENKRKPAKAGATFSLSTSFWERYFDKSNKIGHTALLGTSARLYIQCFSKFWPPGIETLSCHPSLTVSTPLVIHQEAEACDFRLKQLLGKD